MRAIGAAKGFNDGTRKLAQQLDDLVGVDNKSDNSSLDFILHFLPLLTLGIAELCASKPDNPSAALGVWLLERCNAPATAVAELKSWLVGGGAAANRTPEKAGTGKQVRRPPGPPPAKSAANPRARKLKESQEKATEEGAEHEDEESTVAAMGSTCEALGSTVDTEAGDTGDTETGSEPEDEHEPSRVPEDKEKEDEGGSKASPGEKPAEGPEAETDPADKAVPLGRPKASSGGDSVADSTGDVASPKKQRRLSFWQDAEEDQDDDIEAGADGRREGEAKAMQQLRGQEKKHSKGAAVNVSSRLRKFTVNFKSVRIEPPPEDEIIELLRPVPAFQHFPEDHLRKLAAVAKCSRYQPDESIVVFGDVSTDMHVVLEGTGAVSVPHRVGMVRKGDVFSEEAFRLAGAVNTKQVAAVGGPITTLSISAQDFHNLSVRGSLERTGNARKARRLSTAYSSMSGQDPETCKICEFSGMPVVHNYVQTEQDRDLIIQSVKNNKVFSEVLQLTDQQFDIIADCVYLVSISRGEVIMNKGDQGKNTALYIVSEGLMEGNGTLDDRQKEFNTNSTNQCGEFWVRVGDSFGELGLLYTTPRTATIAAARDSKLWVLPRTLFQKVIRMSYSKRIDSYATLLWSIPCLQKHVDENHMDMVADVLEELCFVEGEDVCIEGEDQGLLLILKDGECKVTQNGEFVRLLQKDEWIGEDQLMEIVPSQHTVTVASENATLLVLDRSSLHTVIDSVAMLKRTSLDIIQASAASATKPAGPDRESMAADMCHILKQKKMDALLKRRLSRWRKQASARTSSESINAPDEQVLMMHDPCQSPSNLQPAGFLGEGSFGVVLLMQEKRDQKYYALKVLCKKQIKRESLGQSVANERSVMMLLEESSFIVQLFHTFQDENFIFFLMEPALGGELFDVYNKHNLFGLIDHARFYIACVVLGLQHMHSQRVIYRDLKLENCLLDERGYLKLTDLGIAKVAAGKTYTVCGTADYIAPETLRQVGHNRAADWWACGVLLFIMVAGKSPFDAPEVTQIYKNIIKGFSKVTFPSTFNSDIIEIVKALCRKKPEERITMQKGGVDNLKAVPFYSGFDWEALEGRTMEPPFKPPPPDMEQIAEKQPSRNIDINMERVLDWDGGLGTRPHA